MAAARPSRSERGHVHRAPGEGGPRWRGQGGPWDPAAPPRPLARAPGRAARRAPSLRAGAPQLQEAKFIPAPASALSLQPPGVLESAP